jgi:hypothetical protein
MRFEPMLWSLNSLRGLTGIEGISRIACADEAITLVMSSACPMPVGTLR